MNSTRPLGNTIALVVSALYGVTIGVLAVVGVEPLDVIAAIGAMVVGLVWLLSALLRGRSSRASTRATDRRP